MHWKANPGRSYLRNLAVIRAKWLFLPALVLCCGGSAAQEKPLPIREKETRPNVLVVLMDDLGWRDLGCYGGRFIDTPAADRLAREGMRFTDAYAASPVCSPTRASLLTGQYPVHAEGNRKHLVPTQLLGSLPAPALLTAIFRAVTHTGDKPRRPCSLAPPT